MAETKRKQLRPIDAPFVALGPSGVAIRDRLKGLTPQDEEVLCLVGGIHDDVEHGRWYLTASWQRPVVTTVPLATARAKGMAGVDTNADHFAAYRLDRHGNPVGEPKRFFYDLSGTADHRDAQIRHAISRLLHWAKRCGVPAIGIEDLDFTAEKTREKHGRQKRFRQLVSGIPTGKLKARLVSMATEHGLAIVAVDPAYTSMWGDEHWRKPLPSNTRKLSRHDAAGVAIGRRALGHPIRRRTAPPHDPFTPAVHGQAIWRAIDRRGMPYVGRPCGGCGRRSRVGHRVSVSHSARTAAWLWSTSLVAVSSMTLSCAARSRRCSAASRRSASRNSAR